MATSPKCDLAVAGGEAPSPSVHDEQIVGFHGTAAKCRRIKSAASTMAPRRAARPPDSDVEQHAWLADMLVRSPDCPAEHIRELPPWNWQYRLTVQVVERVDHSQAPRLGSCLRPGHPSPLIDQRSSMNSLLLYFALLRSLRIA